MGRVSGLGARAVLSLAFGAGLGTGLACGLQIEPTIVCGDGFVDLEAGEECDPAAPASVANACVELPERPFGEASCDPQSCTIVFDECSACPGGQVQLPSGQCSLCGNGEIDDDPEAGEFEECEPTPGVFGSPDDTRMCAEVQSPIGKPYTSGAIRRCRPDTCTWDRDECSYCGDGIVDGPELVDLLPDVESDPELCDGDRFDLTTLAVHPSFETCQAASATSGLVLRPNVRCGDDCESLIAADTDNQCCVMAGQPCAPDGSGYQCCYAFAHPGEDACAETVLVDQTIEYRCRPTTPG